MALPFIGLIVIGQAIFAGTSRARSAHLAGPRRSAPRSRRGSPTVQARENAREALAGLLAGPRLRDGDRLAGAEPVPVGPARNPRRPTSGFALGARRQGAWTMLIALLLLVLGLIIQL